MNLHRSVGAKLLLVAGGAIASLLAAALFIVVSSAGDVVSDLSDNYRLSAAGVTARDLSEELRRIEATAATMASSLAVTFRGPETVPLVLDILKPSASATQYVVGSWIIPVPEDNPKDPIHAGQSELGYNKLGQFTPYWVRDGANVSMQVVEDPRMYDLPFYRIPMDSKRASLIETYAQEVNGRTILMTTLSVPVIKDGRPVGVAGLDIALNDLATGLGQLRPFGDGRVMLLSQSAKWLSNPDATMLTKDYTGPEQALVRKAIAEGTAVTFDWSAEDGVLMNRSITPIVFNSMNTVWALVTDIPVSTLNAPVTGLSRNLALGSVAIIVIVLASLYCAIKLLVRAPMDRLLASVRRLGSGNYEQAIEETDRRDEFGTVASALEAFRYVLSEGRRLRVEQDELRVSSQAQRDRQSAIDSARADDLRAFVHAVEAGFARLAAGDLTVRMDQAVAPEFEPIRAHFNQSVVQLEATIGDVVSAVGAMRSGLADITVAVGDLSQRTEQQAASLEETVAALGQVTHGVGQTAARADATRQSASAACREAERGGEVVARAVSAMAEIEQSSQKIGNIIGVIDEIAFQTNLLALNAGVEAARAGEAGRGFAVVAQEVRGLAQRSAEAAKEIKVLIQASGDQVASGVELVSASGASLEAIVAQVGGVAQSIAEMAEAAREQAVSLREVSTAADQMDKVTQQNAAMVEEVTAAAQGLGSETEQLARMMSGFTTGIGRRRCRSRAAPVRTADHNALPKRMAATTARSVQPAVARPVSRMVSVANS